MLTRLRRAAALGPLRTRGQAPDAGFSLIEVVVSIGLIGIVMTAFTTFFVTSISATSAQSVRQVAVQVADEAMEQVRTLKGSAINAGRDPVSTDTQWDVGLAVPAVAEHLIDVAKAEDATAVYPSGHTATLPTIPSVITVSGIQYSRSWYIGTCWRRTDETCVATQPSAAAEDPTRPSTQFFRVVAAVTWQEKNCPASNCSYVSSTMVSTASSDPVFSVGGPSGGWVEPVGLTGTGSRYATSTTLSVSMDKGTSSSGVIETGAQLHRASGMLSNGVCSNFSLFTLIHTDPATPLADPVADQFCYRYKYVVSGSMNNPTSYISDDAKVDTTAPTTPTLAFSGFDNAALVGANTIHYRTDVSGSFTITAEAVDGVSGIARYNFPALGTGWTYVDVALGVRTYSWSPSPASPGATSITATNNAFLDSPGVGFALVEDGAGPSGGSIYATGLAGTGASYANLTTLNLVFSKGTDASGIPPSGATVYRAEATLTASGGTADGVCGTFGSVLLVEYDDPASPMADQVAGQRCYRYTYVVSDAVGNTTTYTNPVDVKVDSTWPVTPELGFSNMLNVAVVDGDLFYDLGASSGHFTVTASSTDAQSGVATYNFPNLGTGWTVSGTGAVRTYSWNSANPAEPTAAHAVTARNHAGLTSSGASLSATNVSTGPRFGFVDAAGLTGVGARYSTSTNLSVTFSAGSDADGIAASGATLSRASATLTNSTCGVYGAYALITGGNDPASPKADTVADQSCYRYRYAVSDTLGNRTTYTSPDIKVLTTAPAAPTLAFTAVSNTYWNAATRVLYYRPPASGGAVTITATGSGSATINWPDFGAGWAQSGTGATRTYTFSGMNPTTTQGTKTVTATNDAGLVSAGTTFTLTADSTEPSGGFVSHIDGYTSGTSVSVTFIPADTDSGSGIKPNGGRMKRRAAPLVDGVCGTLAPGVDLAINPTSPYLDTTVTSGYCYRYEHVTPDNVNNTRFVTTSSLAIVDYAGAVNTTTGLLGQWRLGETLLSSDTFTGTAGSELSSRTGELGATWTKSEGTIDGVLSDAGRLRRNGGNGVSYLSSAVPTTADYQVSADITLKSLINYDFVALMGRVDPAVTDGDGVKYLARYNVSSAQFELIKTNWPSPVTVLGTYSAGLATNGTYTMTLDMVGSRISLLVNGGTLLSVIDTSIPGPGRAGVRLGANGGSGLAQTNTTGIHLDNYRVTPRGVLDSLGTNHGTYYGAPTLGVAGALDADANTAVTFDGVDDYAAVARQIQNDFTIEFWFKSTQGIGTTGTHWWDGAGMVDAERTAMSNDFGISLFADGRVAAGVGRSGGDITLFSNPGFDNGQWHYVAMTRTMATGVFNLYLDGQLVGSRTGSTASLTDSAFLNFGRLANASKYFAGSLDEIAAYGTAISATTARDHYNLGRNDTSGPTGGGVDATGLTGTGSRYSTTTNLNLTFSKGTDERSGVAPGGGQLRRSTATLASGTCGAYSASTWLGDYELPPVADTVPSAQACYRYEYVPRDTLGNTTTYVSPDIKIDNTPPSPVSVALAGASNTYATGSTVFYRSAATSGSFTATASAVDANSGIAKYVFPALGTNWTSNPSGGTTTYSWSGSPTAATGSKSVTATNNAFLASPAGSFTPVADATAPAPGSVTYAGGNYANPSVSISFTAGADAGSGLDPDGGLLQRAAATNTRGTCGTFGTYGTITNGADPTSPFTDTTVSTGTCYMYRYVTSDNVGNQYINTSTNTVRVNSGYAATVLATPGIYSYWRLGESTGTIAVDSVTSVPNNGTYVNAPTKGVTGAIPADSNTAATFNGSTQYVTVARQIQDDFSIEFWFKSTQGRNLGDDWWNGAGMVDAESNTGSNDFGVSLRADGRVTAGTGQAGTPDYTIISGSGGYNNNVWHHVVFTRSGVTGAMRLYVDGGLTAFGTGYAATLTGSASLNFGRLASGYNPYAGSLDEIAVYGTVLSATTVAQHYNRD